MRLRRSLIQSSTGDALLSIPPLYFSCMHGVTKSYRNDEQISKDDKTHEKKFIYVNQYDDKGFAMLYIGKTLRKFEKIKK